MGLLVQLAHWNVERKRRRDARRAKRRWRNSTPAEQVTFLVQMLHTNPVLRQMFRDALSGKSTEATNLERRRERQLAREKQASKRHGFR